MKRCLCNVIGEKGGGGLSGAQTLYTECDYQHHCPETPTLLFRTLKVSTTGVEHMPWECRGGGGFTHMCCHFKDGFTCEGEREATGPDKPVGV